MWGPCPVSSGRTRVRCPGHVSSIQWQDTCPLSSVQDTCPLTFTGQVAVLGPPIIASHHGGHLAGHPGIIITCCSSNTDKYTTYNIPTANFSSIQSLKPGNKKNCLLFVCFELRKNCRDLGSRIPLALSKIFKGSPNAILSQICFSSNI